MVFNATFNNISVISWWSVLLVEKIGVPEFDYGAYASNCNNYSSQKSITWSLLVVCKLSPFKIESKWKLTNKNKVIEHSGYKTNIIKLCIMAVLFFSVMPWLEWVSEWLLFNTNSAMFQLYHGENKLIFNEIMMMSALD